MPQPPAPENENRRLLGLIRAVLNGSLRVSPALAGQLTYQLLGAPRRKVPVGPEIPFLETAHTHRLAVGKSSICTYHWPGAGPRILLAHGWDSHTGRWHALGDALLAAGYDLHALDAPAHGQSSGRFFTLTHYARALSHAMQQVRPDAVIGHSAGGMAAIYYFTQYPHPIQPRCLATMSTPAELTDFVRAFQQTLQLDPRIIDGLDLIFRRRLDRPLHYFSISQFAKALRLPGLILHDEEDPVAPVSGAHAIHGCWSGSELALYRGLGHSLRGESVNERVLGWLEMLLVEGSG